MIQSHNTSNQKSQILGDEIITKSSHSMMEKFEYCRLVRQLNEDEKLTFDDIMHRKQLYLDAHIYLL